MSTRPLRQYYDPVTIEIDADIAPGLGPWLRHRHRFVASLEKLSDDEWSAPTRCTAWDIKDVVSHLVSVDAFWVFTLGAAKSRSAPQKFLEHFDPSTGTDAMVAATRDLSSAEMLDKFASGTESLIQCVEGFEAADWQAPGESPLGHLPAHFLFGHAFWDSWLHERDIFVVHGPSPAQEPDEIVAVTSFALLFAGMQGGLVDDPLPVGAGLEEPLDVTLAFDEIERPLRVRYDRGTRVQVGDAAAAIAVGSAIGLVECGTGRRPMSELDPRVPANFAAHLDRAVQVL